MEEIDVKKQFEIKELELNALLEITQAINSNLPEESLYKIYNFTLRSNLNIRKTGPVCTGQRLELQSELRLTPPVHPHQAVAGVQDHTGHNPLAELRECEFTEFDIVIPVAHKDRYAGPRVRGRTGYAQHEHENGDSIQFIQALSNIIIVAIENKKLARKQLEQEAFRKELEIASDVQQFLFPEKLPNYRPAESLKHSYLPHDLIGGDYYDIYRSTRTSS